MMKENYLSLDPHDQQGIMKILQVIFGIICIAVTLYYIITGIRSDQSRLTVWIGILFLLIFGIYLILSGLGKTKKYFRTRQNSISFKQHSVLPAVSLLASNIERIEIYPLSIKFFIKGRNKFIFRFGISYPEIIDPVKQEVIGFAGSKNIEIEIMDEEI
ncbi:MAG TPA: hypothetical protein DDW27_11430 [Bacteroidales bacterium]|nr:hypothetical protein [Bacteroidales bacterium]